MNEKARMAAILLIGLALTHARLHTEPRSPRFAHADGTLATSQRALRARLASLPAGPAAACGPLLTVGALLPDPDDLPDRLGERVILRNDGPVPVDAADWSLGSGGRGVYLTGFPIPAGGSVQLGGPEGTVPLGKLRLKNAAGCLVLRDPCGVPRSSVSWGHDAELLTEPGGWLVVRSPWNGAGPVRAGPETVDGGCGQT